jgi:hypothetical protein
MVNFHTKNQNFGEFGRALEKSCWDILWSFGIFYSYLVNFVIIWYIFPFWYVVPITIWQPWRQHPSKLFVAVLNKF